MNQQEWAKENLKRQMIKKQDILIETDQASVMKDNYPKAQYHFLVVAKAEITKVTALKREHLPLLDHMMELANQIIDQQNHLPSSSFLVGFKIDAFMDSLTMHVISNDFYSVSMRKLKHWNGFNTDLFLTYQAVYALLQIQGSIEPLSEEKALILRETKRIRCNQCDFECDNLATLKFHLYEHWKKREDDFEVKKQVDKITKLLDESKINDGKKPAIDKPEVDAPSQTKSVAKNWRQNHDQNPTDAKEPPIENWRLKMNQTPDGQQSSMVPYQNKFAKHFQKAANRQNLNQQQQQQNVNPFQQMGLIAPRPGMPFRPFIPQPVPNGTVPLHQFQPQAPAPLPFFNPFRQPPNMAQLPPQIRYNDQNCDNPNLNNASNGWYPRTPNFFPRPQYNHGQNNGVRETPQASESLETQPKWKPRPQHNQPQNNGNAAKDNAAKMKTQAKESVENKPKWKPRPQHNQGQNNGNAAKDNAAKIKTQAKESVENKPKWKPRPQHNQEQDKGVRTTKNGAAQNKPNWKPKGPKQQNPGQKPNTSNANKTSSTN